MCKVLAITDMSKVQDLAKLVNVVAPKITERDNDGFGWAALGDKGVFGERTTNKGHQYRLDKNYLSVKIPVIKQTYNAIGQPSKLCGAGIFHGRTSTNSKSLVNTHPIVKHEWTLIHNGVVTNTGPKYDMLTSNDTEHIVHYLGTVGIKGIEEHLTGYYAVAAIAPTGELHVVRDSIANLHVAYIETIDAHMFGTTVDLIETVAKKMEWKIGPVEAVADDIHMIFDRKGMLTHQSNISPRGYDSRESSLASKSLGYSIDRGFQLEVPKVIDATKQTRKQKRKAKKSKAKVETLTETNWNTIESWNDDYPTDWQSKVTDADFERMESADIDAWLDWYQEKLRHIDDTWTIVDANGFNLSSSEFRQLDLTSKMTCVVTGPDGEEIEPPMASGWSY